jgi:dihydroxy-acid dehydratase
MVADLKPSGRYQMAELIEIGGIQPLMKILLYRRLRYLVVLALRHQKL